MRLQRFSIISSTLLSLPSITTGSSLPDACLSIKSTIGNKPDALVNKFDEIVCKQGCRPRMDEFESWGKETILNPLISTVLQKIEAPSSPEMVELISGQITMDECRSGGPLDEQDICADDAALGSFAQCLKQQVVPALMKEIERYSSLITESMCQKVNLYLQGPDLWEVVIPGAFEEYAKGCSGIQKSDRRGRG